MTPQNYQSVSLLCPSLRDQCWNPPSYPIYTHSQTTGQRLHVTDRRLRVADQRRRAMNQQYGTLPNTRHPLRQRLDKDRPGRSVTYRLRSGLLPQRPSPSNLCDTFPIVSSLDLPNNVPSQPNILSTTRCPFLRQTAGNRIPSSDPIDSRVSGQRTSLGNKGQPRQSLKAIKAMEVVYAVPPLRPYSTCLGCCVTYHVSLLYGDPFV